MLMTQTTVKPDFDSSAPIDAHEQEERIVQWLVNYLADVLDLDPGRIDTKESFQKIGLDSSAAVGMTGDLSNWLGRDVDATVAYDYPNIRALAHAVATDI
jgi:acyl carrier protein